LASQEKRENVHQEQAYFAEVKALLEDQYPMPLETALLVEKPKAITESTSFVNKSPNTQALKAAQTSAQDYWEGMADSAVEEGGVLGFPKYLGSKTMGALADIGHGIGQSVDALVHNPEESISGIAKGVGAGMVTKLPKVGKAKDLADTHARCGCCSKHEGVDQS
jgi:hypothetical protein